jgi:hypothetical protein
MVEAGRATCSRCGLPIRGGEAWHLDHADSGSGYRGPSHAECNSRAPAIRGHVAKLPRPLELPPESAGPTDGSMYTPAEGGRAERYWKYELARCNRAPPIDCMPEALASGSSIRVCGRRGCSGRSEALAAELTVEPSGLPS